MQEIRDAKKQIRKAAIRKWLFIIGIVCLMGIILSWSSWDEIKATLSKQAWVFIVLLFLKLAEESIWKDKMLAQMLAQEEDK